MPRNETKRTSPAVAFAGYTFGMWEGGDMEPGGKHSVEEEMNIYTPPQ